MVRVGNRDQKKRYRDGNVEVDHKRRQTRVGIGLLSQDKKYCLWFKGD